MEHAFLSRSSLTRFASVGAALAVSVFLAAAAQGICGDGTPEVGEDCDDGNTADGDCCTSTCTFESGGSPCSGATLCRQSGACDGAGTCVAVPRSGCHGALKSLLLLVDNNGNDAKDKLKWKWGSLDPVPMEELGVPTGTTNYALCIYAANDLIDEPEIAPDPVLWEPASHGYKYKDALAASDGIRKVRIAAGIDVRPKASVQGKGVDLPDPVLDLPLPVTVQFVNSSNLCLEAVFELSGVKYNNAARFKAKSP